MYSFIKKTVLSITTFVNNTIQYLKNILKLIKYIYKKTYNSHEEAILSKYKRLSKYKAYSPSEYRKKIYDIHKNKSIQQLNKLIDSNFDNRTNNIFVAPSIAICLFTITEFAREIQFMHFSTLSSISLINIIFTLYPKTKMNSILTVIVLIINIILFIHSFFLNYVSKFLLISTISILLLEILYIELYKNVIQETEKNALERLKDNK